jgi:hypothetical protein
LDTNDHDIYILSGGEIVATAKPFIKLTLEDGTEVGVPTDEIMRFQNWGSHFEVMMNNKTSYKLLGGPTLSQFLSEISETAAAIVMNIEGPVEFAGDLNIADTVDVHITNQQDGNRAITAIPQLTIADIISLNVDSLPNFTISVMPNLNIASMPNLTIASMPTLSVTQGVQSLTITQSTVAVTNSSTTLIAANAARKYLRIQNQSPTSKVWIRIGASAATTANSELLMPLQSITWPIGQYIPTAEIRAIGDTVTSKNIHVEEGT